MIGMPFKSFDGNCRVYGTFDILVAVHGAGMSNLWCATPGAAVVEIITHENATMSMYGPLAAQMGLAYCSVGVKSGTFDTPIQPNPHVLEACVRSSAKSLTNQHDRVRHGSGCATLQGALL